MRKWLYCTLVCAGLMLGSAGTKADNNTGGVADKSSAEYIAGIYKKINFCREGKLDQLVFEQAYRGYINLKNAGKLNSDKEIITVCDYSLSANTHRMWVIDLRNNKILYNTYVAHGQGSGEEFATAFSNTENSHQSSVGFYVTGETYLGEHGTSLRLHGMDNRYNDAAYDRGIVLHGADYVCDNFIAGNKRLGRSWGCPAVGAALAPELIDLLKDGTCLFIYYPSKKYLSSSFWLNKKIKALPDNSADSKFMLQTAAQPDGTEVSQLLNVNR